MNNHRQPAKKPDHLRTNLLSPNPTAISPAVQGAASAFSPKSPLAHTGSITPLASPSTLGARYAARAAGTQSHPSAQLSQSAGARNDVSPERGRSLRVENGMSGGAARLATSPSKLFIPVTPTSPERSPSTIAARYASSQSTSPARSPERSSQRKPNIAPVPRNGISLATRTVPSFISTNPVSLSTHEATSNSFIRSQALKFDKIPQLPQTTAQSSLSNILLQRPDLTPASSLSIQRLKEEDFHLGTPRDRAHSVGALPPTHRALSNEPSDPRHQDVIGPNLENVNKKLKGASNSNGPPVPLRRSQRSADTTLLHPKDASNPYRGMTVNTLADAMVASSLASSRAASPAKKPPPPSPGFRRRSRSFSALYELSAKYNIEPYVKPPRPQRPMKQTLRKPSETDDDENELVKRGRRHWMRKHPNKHHEGDRKRWRDKVTEQERKRYEGVFAANRGLFIGQGYFEPSPSALAGHSAEGNRVVNVIVRDIWERSRLPQEILMEIYDLVTPKEEQSLNRDQFVVGMWLIDQRLKGRKLPVKVSSSVWSSVRHPDGLRLKG